ncbi:Peptidoglycan-binding LysM [Desulfovibrio sp. DV]|uniref:hypothetical protein n=1 Tax=Desulfovibrio sp. DV TaxID=1844708 RepID=UPI00094BB7F8|nr:hypothetical protein [Desulfovibrio sp. DV]OLN24416.1 Peptidoglycan-binding LysM [Desulfovibrio sp. DV]
MSFVPRFVAILLLVFVAACAPAARNASKTPAKPAQSAAKAQPAPGKAAPPAKAAPAGPPATVQATPPPLTQTAPPAVAQAGPPPGFGGIPWGAPTSSQPGLAQFDVSAENGTTTCLWPQGPKDIFGATVREAYYEFFKNQFYHIWINFDGMAAYETALAGLTRTYGPPTQENRDKYYHAWTIGEVNIYCAFHPDLNEGDVSFFYQPLYERMVAARKTGSAKPQPRSAKP